MREWAGTPTRIFWLRRRVIGASKLLGDRPAAEMALAQALRSASASCGALAPVLLRSQALCASQLLGSQGSLAAAAAATPPPAATALRSLFTSAAVAAPASEPAEVRVSELIDAHCGAYGSEQQQASPLQVLEPGFRWVLA